MHAQHFLHQIFLALEVETMAGHGGRPSLGGTRAGADGRQFEALEDPLHFGVGDFLADQERKAGLTQRHIPRRRQVGGAAGLHHRAGTAAGNGQQERRRSFHGGVLQAMVDAAFVTVRGVGVQAVAARRGGHRHRREEGAFEEDVARCRGDAGALAAHDAGDGHRPGMIGNQQRAFIDRHAAAVEHGQRLAGASVAHHDAAGERVEVEGVHRLAQFEQHVVGDIDYRIDGAQTAAAQAFAQPQRRGPADVDVLNDTAQIARAAGRVLHLHRESRVDGCRHGGDVRRFCRRIAEQRHFPSEATQA